MKSKKIITITIFIIIALSFISVDWQNNNLHNNGYDMITKIGSAALSPDLSVLNKALSAAIVTVVYAAAGMSLAIIIGFLLSILGSDVLISNAYIKRIIRNILGAMRAIHELVWALFFVAFIGLSPFAAIFALAIPYGGMLGKVFIDIFDSVSSSKLESMKQLGASKLQIFVYCYIPETYYDLVSYVLYRLECAIRSSTVLSFVGIGGLGQRIKLTLGDLKYDEMFTYVYMLIFLVLILDIWGNVYRKNKNKDSISPYVFISLMMFSWLYVFTVDEASISSIFNQKNLDYTLKFLSRMIGIDSSSKAFFNINEIKTVFLLTLETIQMSIIAITISTIMMIVTVIGATRQYSKKILYGLLRISYLISRAIPELIWALIIVFIVKPGIMSGALALALHNYGILSKLCTEVIEELDENPLNSLRQTGASKSQIMIYGVIPMAYKRFISYIIYRWEIVLRTTIVVGFVGAGGLGFYFKTGMSLFHYTKVTLVLVCYIILVKIADYIAIKLNNIYS